MNLFESLKSKLSIYARELGCVESKIEHERITNPAHMYCERKIELEAMISLLEDLMCEVLNQSR